MTYEQIK